MELEGQRQNTAISRWMMRGWFISLAVLAVLWGGWAMTVWISSKGQKNPIRMLVNAASFSSAPTRYLKPPYQYFRTWQHVLEEAKRLRRPIFLDLYADWCYPCKKLEQETFSHPSVHKILQKYVMVKFNIDKPEGRSLVNRYRVERFPTTLMLDWQGREVERVIGFYPPRFFRTPVEDALEPSQQNIYENLRARWSREPGNLPLALRLADRALLRRSLQESERLYRQILQIDRKDTKRLGSQALFGLARLQTRESQYLQALPILAQLHREYPRSLVRIDAYRLQLYCYYKLSRNNDYHQTYAVFRKAYPKETTKFE